VFNAILVKQLQPTLTVNFCEGLRRWQSHPNGVVENVQKKWWPVERFLLNMNRKIGSHQLGNTGESPSTKMLETLGARRLEGYVKSRELGI